MADIELRLDWVVIYVDDPPAAAAFYESTFGLRREFDDPDGAYAQLDTGTTKLAFASYELGEKNFAGGVARNTTEGQSSNVELAFVADDVDAAYTHALAAGCIPLAEPADKPHGQRCAFIRDPFGTLVELATPL
jgi:lactoylglutathione lyase